MATHQNMKIKWVYLLIIIIVGLISSSCYTQRDKSLWQESKSFPRYEKANFEPYKIHVNDELIFRVTSTDEEFVILIDAGSSASQQQGVSYRVYQDGTIDLPFIDSVKVAGLTIHEAVEVIQRRFIQLIPDAEVKLALSNKVYTVIGEAGNGLFPIYRDKLTIYQALAQSGEIALSGDRKHIKIIRKINGEPHILEFDIRPRSVIDSKYYYIYPNDVIYVQKESASFYKTNSYSALLGLITSSISLFTTVFYYTKFNQK